MKLFITFFLLLFAPASVKANLVHSLASSTQLTVSGAATVSERIGSTYVVTGTNVQVGSGNSDVFGGLTAGSATAAATMKAGTYDIDNDGQAFSFSETWTQGDAIPAIGAGVDVASGSVADMPAFGKVTTQAGGHAGNLAGTIDSQSLIGITAGGSGTTAIGQFVSTITVD